MDPFTRRIIGFAIRFGDVDGPALCRLFNHAISRQGTPSDLSSDNDPLFLYHPWQANLRILAIEEIKTVPFIPLSHPLVERLIGIVRREFLESPFSGMPPTWHVSLRHSDSITMPSVCILHALANHPRERSITPSCWKNIDGKNAVAVSMSCQSRLKYQFATNNPGWW
jgi:hypothetical protein